MDGVDLNLLAALDVLLAEASVTGAARRLGLSPSAMSRTLTRLRRATGDPLLVRAGRGLVPTPRATELRDRVHELAREARAVLRPQPACVDIAALDRSFTIRASEGFLEVLAAPVVAAVARAASQVQLRFVPKPDKEVGPLREGLIDLEIGLRGTSAPEIRTRLLFRDRFVGVVRTGHPLLAGGEVTLERYAACRHVAASREGETGEAVDAALRRLGLGRRITVAVPGYPDAMRIARHSELVAMVPRSCLGNGLLGDPTVTSGLEGFGLPVPVPEFLISAMWHPRLDADPAHRWLRETVVTVCRQAYPGR
ncbi:LysR family transcriptional regulator [Roseomonas mucosa]|uniref:LysR family transcriptional regulator n=1 Tax=Roseomonas mucosa TaxID=207340 RepID=UPI0028CF407B|nr:LysR family transcriptional regulator [Roseomonas mucosa]MDT8356731.1 LysR family transcriptional regulator [Roseomonas mucosa]